MGGSRSGNRYGPRHILSLYLSQKGKCSYCTRELTSKNVTVDHVIPRSWGGINGQENRTLACSKCNHLKGKYENDRAAEEGTSYVDYKKILENYAIMLSNTDPRVGKMVAHMKARFCLEFFREDADTSVLFRALKKFHDAGN